LPQRILRLQKSSAIYPRYPVSLHNLPHRNKAIRLAKASILFRTRSGEYGIIYPPDPPESGNDFSDKSLPLTNNKFRDNF
jgi:hypothetical protein